MTATVQQPRGTADRPTIVLVHGAFADGSSWNGVIERLQRQGYDVVAPANPLRGVIADSAYIASVLTQIDGPVLLVGHSYGGAVISNAATKAANVVGLVFVAAFAPDDGERLGEVTPESKDSILNTALVERRYPTGRDGETAVEFMINPAVARDVFAADLSVESAALIAAIQRPVAALAFSDPSGPPAWKTLPSWAVVATGDRAAGTDLVLSMARRAGAEIVEVEGSHLIMGVPGPSGERRHPPGGRGRRSRVSVTGMTADTVADTSGPPTFETGTHASFGPLEQIDAGVLSVGYAQAGRPTAPRSFSCTAGPTTSTATSTSRRCCRPQATA